MIYTITLTIKKTGSYISRDYDLSNLDEENIGKKVIDMKYTIENATEINF